MRPFACDHCGHTVFFENDRCNQCGSALGYLPGESRMVALQSPHDDPYQRRDLGDEGGQLWLACQNRHDHAVCNWLLDPGDSHALCRSCRLNARIPDLGAVGNLARWRRIEQAKRRVLYSLIALGLSPQPKAAPDDELGLSFELLAQLPGDAPVMIGHDRGVVTLNIAEADDLQREQIRVAMGEPVRTLLGHLRHEVSHYLQYRHLRDNAPAETCRAAFGDERADYAQALARYHAEGAPAQWQQQFISAYASAHPWEDWAETCAHYLLITDAVETAAQWGLQLRGPAVGGRVTVASHLADGDSPSPAPPQVHDLVLQQWLPLAGFTNAMNRSMGLPDSYPYLMPNPVLRKMATAALLLHHAAEAAGASVPARC